MIIIDLLVRDDTIAHQRLQHLKKLPSDDRLGGVLYGTDIEHVQIVMCSIISR